MLLLVLAAACLPSGIVDDDALDDDDDVVQGDDGGHGGSNLSSIDPNDLPQVEGACRQPELVTVDFIADGDTIVALTSQGSETIRFIGVNTPELGYNDTEEECFGQEAKDFITDLLSDGEVWLTFDLDCVDPYDRTLAYLHLGTQEQDFVERNLLRGGYAEVMTFEPNDAFEDLFEADEAAARDAGAGQWSACQR